MSDIRQIWKKQSSTTTNKIVLRNRIDEVRGLNCYIATITQSGTRLFILELSKGINVPLNYLKRFVGVEIQIIPGNTVPELCILLQEEELSDIFSYFIEDIIKALIPVDDCQVALTRISGKIIYWRRLFGKFSGEILSIQQQRGLYGELLFLNKLLDNIPDQSKIINGWHGPLAANQDFWYDGFALEVKTSKANKPTIKISNEYQLDLSGLKGLCLVFYKLNEYPGGKDTLCSLISKIRGRLDAGSLELFNERLVILGVDPSIEEEEYNSLSYSIGFETVYRINEEFPAITRDTINAAISSVSYEIEPKLCADFEEDITIIFSQISK